MDLSVFLGAPGSGKGTQAKRLAQTYGFHHFSTGDMLRSAIVGNTPVGISAKKFMDNGELVPDEVMIRLIEGALSPLKPSSKILLDGFPRTVPQAEALDKQAHTQVRQAIFFQIPESVLISRLTGRRTCQKCGEPYHVLFLPPQKENVCDRCGGPLIQRSDDKEEVVGRRLQVFNQQNAALLDYYRAKNKLSQCDANQSVDAIYQKLLEWL